MIFDKLNQYYKDKEKSLNNLREDMFRLIKDSNEFIFKMLGKENSVEYYKWRLDFDKKRYSIAQHRIASLELEEEFLDQKIEEKSDYQKGYDDGYYDGQEDYDLSHE
jgi:hypothetical protein